MSATGEKTGSSWPTSDPPLVISFGTGGLALSEVEYWVEEGEQIIRSLEYDVIAAADEPRDAIRKFVDLTIAYARLLSEADNPTEDDVKIASMIMGRLLRIYEQIEAEAEQEEDRPILYRLRHVRRRRDQRWRLRPVAHC